MILEPWIETYSGKKFYFLNPQPDMVDIGDIAQSLSLQCRFLGHVNRFYSVAEHSLNVSREAMHRDAVTSEVSWEDGLKGLLHDASEAYLMDIPSPIKQFLNNYEELEEGVMKAIFSRFGLELPLGEKVKLADKICLKNEARFLLPSKGASWIHLYPTYRERFVKPLCLTPSKAKKLFLETFDSLVQEINYESPDPSYA